MISKLRSGQKTSLLWALAATAALVSPARAEEASAKDAFLEANILSIFYHELGHAVIDLMQVPIFGQEEDAADVMAVLLIDSLFEEETAQSLAYDSAFGYINDPEGTEEVEYWDLHGPDEQRYFNHVCLFFGANPEERDDLAEELGLPEYRAETCPEEYDQAANSWGAIFDEMAELSKGTEISFVAGSGADADLIASVLAAEIEALNNDFQLPENVRVFVDTCGEANAFYDPGDVSITFCEEFIPHLRDLFDRF